MNAPVVIDRILGGLWGSLVGDALGVPVEFKDRMTVQLDPVTDMREFGTHKQPRGTWSDDSSILLCTADSLLNHEFSLADMGERFVRWMTGALIMDTHSSTTNFYQVEMIMSVFTTDHPMTSQPSWLDAKDYPWLSAVCSAFILALCFTPAILAGLYFYFTSDIGAEPNPFPDPWFAVAAGGVLSFAISLIGASAVVVAHRLMRSILRARHVG